VHTLNDQQLREILSSLPNFFDLSKSIRGYADSPLLLDFYSFVFNNYSRSQSQIYQDLFVSFVMEGKTEGVFVEAGATNGISLSNSLLLEQEYDWRGLLVEPDPQWHASLQDNRPEARIDTRCLFSKSGSSVDFNSCKIGELSTISDFVDKEKGGPLDHSELRRDVIEKCLVETVSLMDVIQEHLPSEEIDYISIDTEGSEYDILKTFDFKACRPKVFTVEHNYTDNQLKIQKLFYENRYVQVFPEQSFFDAWFVSYEWAAKRGYL
jgi:FkbM family methyltransferase